MRLQVLQTHGSTLLNGIRVAFTARGVLWEGGWSREQGSTRARPWGQETSLLFPAPSSCRATQDKRTIPAPQWLMAVYRVGRSFRARAEGWGHASDASQGRAAAILLPKAQAHKGPLPCRCAAIGVLLQGGSFPEL